MHNPETVPRWIVESDPSWERSVDSNLGILRWCKKGTSLRAVCSPTSIFCTLIDDNYENSNDGNDTGLYDRRTLGMKSSSSSEQFGINVPQTVASEITKYLSSRYLNPMNSSLIDHLNNMNTPYHSFLYRKFIR